MLHSCALHSPLESIKQHLPKVLHDNGRMVPRKSVGFPGRRWLVLKPGSGHASGGVAVAAAAPERAPVEVGEINESVAQVEKAVGSVVATVSERETSVSTSTAAASSIPAPVKHGVIGVGAFAVLVTLAAGIRSMWIHKEDDNLRLQLKKASKDAAAKMEEIALAHRDEVQKVSWEYSSKLSAKESESRAREREAKDALEEGFAKTLAVELSNKERELTDLLSEQHKIEMANLESKWKSKLDGKAKDLAKQKDIASEIKKQMKEIQTSQKDYFKREKEFEQKVAKYSEAISIVAPGGELDGLRKKVDELSRDKKTLEQELRKVKPDMPPVVPSSATDGAASAKRLRLVAAGTTLPDIEKVDTGGEDAFFVSQKGYGAFGVADGVGEWADQGVNPSKYPKQFMEAAAQMLGRSGSSRTPRLLDVLSHAYGKVRIPGSATALVAAMKNNGDLEVANVGDCGVRVIREGKCVFATRPHMHEFNTPYQLGWATHYEDTDHPSDADIYHFKVKGGDIVVGGSDGLFDNVWDDDLAAMVTKEVNGGVKNAQEACDLSEKIAEAAHIIAQSKTVKTPWAKDRAASGSAGILGGFFAQGGKMDDCTVVVGVIEE